MTIPRVNLPGGLRIRAFSGVHLKSFINWDIELTVADNSCVTYDFRYLFGVNAQFSQLISLIFHPALRHKPYEVHHLEQPRQTFIAG